MLSTCPFPDRGFFRRADVARRYRDVLDEVAMFAPPPTLPTDPDECGQVLLDVLRPETRNAIAALAAQADRPELPLIRHVCRRTGARVEPVAAAFGLVRRARDWARADVEPVHLPTGDVERLAAFVLYRACGGRTQSVAVGDD